MIKIEKIKGDYCNTCRNYSQGDRNKIIFSNNDLGTGGNTIVLCDKCLKQLKESIIKNSNK